MAILDEIPDINNGGTLDADIIKDTVETAVHAKDTAEAATNTVSAAVVNIVAYEAEITDTVQDLATQIGEKQGTTIKSGGVALANLDLDIDIFNISGGNA